VRYPSKKVWDEAQIIKDIESPFLQKEIIGAQKSPKSSAKEPYIIRKRALNHPQKSPTSSAKEPYIIRKRALHLPKKSPTSSEKIPISPSKDSC